MISNPKKSIGERIRSAREEMRMTQSDLAERLGKTPKAVSSYETGISMLRADEMFSLSSALNKPISYFYLGEFQVTELAQIAGQLEPDFRHRLMNFASELLATQQKFNEELKRATSDLFDTGIIYSTGESVSDFRKRTDEESEVDASEE